MWTDAVGRTWTDADGCGRGTDADGRRRTPTDRTDVDGHGRTQTDTDGRTDGQTDRRKGRKGPIGICKKSSHGK
eukprot:905017-Prymnesium_polylepis.1